MKFQRSSLFATIVLVAACGMEDSPVEPQFGVVPERGKPQEIACRPADLKAVQNGKIKPNDCLYGDGQREDIYRVDQLALGQSDLSGATMLTFQADAAFDGIFGVSNWDETRFGDPVYGSDRFTAGTPDGAFSVIGSAPEYKMFFSGADETQGGKYTVTTTVSPTTNACVAGHLTFLEGSGAFSSSINDGDACAGTVVVGPNEEADIIYQFWYAKATQGQEVTVSIDGVDPNDPTITLAVIRWGSGFNILDFGDGPGDTDRSITFTAPFWSAYYYIEVSAAPGASSPYNLSFSVN